MSKKILFYLSVILIFTGCSANKSKKIEEVKNNVKDVKLYSFLDGKDIEITDENKINVISELVYNNEKPEELKEYANNVFVGRVISLDNIEGYTKDNRSGLPNSIGNIQVINNIVGDTPVVIKYSRPGGVMMVKDYYNGAEQFSIDKQNHLRSIASLPLVQDDTSFISVFEQGDSSLVVGDTYLFYANYDNYKDTYNIEGFQYGSLKVDNYNPKAKLQIKEINNWVLNYPNGITIKYIEYINKYFK